MMTTLSEIPSKTPVLCSVSDPDDPENPAKRPDWIPLENSPDMKPNCQNTGGNNGR